MFPAQTSLIPAQISLARYLLQGNRVFGDYPYWYSGTTPFRYLTGPVVPGLLVLLHRIIPNASLFDLMFGVIGVFWVIGGIGVYWLARQLEAPKKTAILTGILFVFGPIVPLLFSFSNGISLVAFCLLPWVLGFFIKSLRKPKLFKYCLIMMTLAVLTDISVTPSLILGLLIIELSVHGWKKIEKNLGKILLLVVGCGLLVTIWYTLGFWWQLIVSPSFAGKPLYEVAGLLLKLLPVALALLLASVSGQFAKMKSPFSRFCFYWLFVFGFLSFIRFLSDPDFWQDWTGYGLELQLGLSVLIGLYLSKLIKKTETKGLILKAESNKKIQSKDIFFFLLLVTSYLLLIAWVFNRYVIEALQTDISQTAEYQVGEELNRLVKPGQRVFLSGTTAFWLNAFWDIPQVRGGKDEVSVDPHWRAAVWEVREGEDGHKAVGFLKSTGVDYLVVHTSVSSEYYHDFKNLQKFENIKELKKVWEQNGDVVYKITIDN